MARLTPGRPGDQYRPQAFDR